MPASKALTISNVIQQTLNLQNGSRTFGPATLAAGITTISVVLDTAQWNTGTTLTVHTDISFDNGQTWELNSPDEVVQPPFVDKAGNPMNAFLAWSVRNEASATRQFRVVTVVASGPLHTTVTVQTQSA